jgi:hypothetical protein
MFLLRIIGLWLLILGFMAFVYDATKTMANNGSLSITSLGGHWVSLHEQSYKFVEEMVSTSLHPFVWDPVLESALLLPAWLALGVIGSWLYWIGRKRKRIEIFLN